MNHHRRFVCSWPSLFSPSLRRFIAWAIWVISTTLLMLNLFMLLFSRSATDANAWSPFIIGLLYPPLGLLVARRQPENLVGWLLSTLGLGVAVLGFSKAYAQYGFPFVGGPLPGEIALAWLASWLWGMILALIPFLILLFPAGRLPSPRWQLLIWLISINSGLLLGFAAVYPGGLYADPAVRNPLAFTNDAVIVEGFTLTQALQLLLVVVAICSLFVRFRRAARDERQQIKWIVSAFALNGLLLILDAWIPPGFWGTNIDGIGGLILPVAIGAAILRYHLWDIDRIINRTVVYGVLTACIVGIYIVVVSYLGALFRTSGNLLISLIATSMVAVLFQPLRGWLQHGINRLFYGQRDEPYVVLRHLSQRLGATMTPEALLPVIVETLVQALKLPYAAITLYRADGLTHATSYGSPKGQPAAIPIVYQAKTLGYLELLPRGAGEEWTPQETELLDAVARQTGVVAHALRLTEALQQSRELLVLAREEERRHLRRELHDDLGPQLGGLTLQVGAIQNHLRHDPTKAEELLSELGGEIETAAKAIRRLAYHLRPPTLDELGLVEAIRAYAVECQQRFAHDTAQQMLHVNLEIPERIPLLPAAVDVVGYRIVQEALTNIVRHAEARTCWITLRVTHDPEMLHVEIKDDGRGIPPDAHLGIGMLSMRERAEEIGGSCTVTPSPASRGTQVVVRLPIRKEK